jgi:hypothetical protein
MSFERERRNREKEAARRMCSFRKEYKTEEERGQRRNEATPTKRTM